MQAETAGAEWQKKGVYWKGEARLQTYGGYSVVKIAPCLAQLNIMTDTAGHSLEVSDKLMLNTMASVSV